MVLVVEAEFRIGYAVRGGADVGGDAGGVGLEGEDIEVAHDLHVFAAFVAVGDFDFDERGVGVEPVARAEAGIFEGGVVLTGFDGGDAAFDGADGVEVFVEFVLIAAGEVFAEIASAAEDEVEHLAVEWGGFGGLALGGRFAEEPVEDVARVGFGGDWLGGGAIAAVGVVSLVEALLVFLVSLGHGGQLEGGEGSEATEAVSGDLVGGDGDADLVAVFCVREGGGEPCGEFEGVGGAVEGGDGDAGDALHEETLVEDGAERGQGGRWAGEEGFGAVWPELFHDDPVGHVHEAEADGRFGGGGGAGVGPAHGFEEREGEGSAEAFEAGAAVEAVVGGH